MNAVVLVILVPFLTAIGTALLHDRPRAESALNAVSCLGLAAFVFWLLAKVDADGPQVSMMGGYPAPYGIAFVADRLSCIMLCLSMLVASVVALYVPWTVTPLQQSHFFYPLFQVLLLGVNWSFITGDLFNLFVSYEVMLIGSYGVMMCGSSRQQVRQTLTYVAINLLGGSLFVVGLGLVYSIVGTLNMADIAVVTSRLAGPRAGMLTAASMVLLAVFALKAAAFPLFFWLPDSYPIVPLGVNGFFAGLLTKVGIYSLLRVFVMTFRQPGNELALQALLVASAFTMVVGVLGALCQWEVRRVLSWHIISQVGYMVMGIGLAADAGIATAAVAATIFYVVHHIVVKASLFLVGGIAEEISGSGRLKEMGGIALAAPGAAALFFVSALSLAGMPPFSGFLAKLVLVRTALRGAHFWVVAAAVATSFLTLLSMMKIWSYAFWGDWHDAPPRPLWRRMAAPVSVLVATTVLLGLWAQPFLRIASDAARGIVDPVDYVHAVLGPEASVEARSGVGAIASAHLAAEGRP